MIVISSQSFQKRRGFRFPFGSSAVSSPLNRKPSVPGEVLLEGSKFAPRFSQSAAGPHRPKTNASLRVPVPQRCKRRSRLRPRPASVGVGGVWLSVISLRADRSRRTPPTVHGGHGLGVSRPSPRRGRARRRNVFLLAARGDARLDKCQTRPRSAAPAMLDPDETLAPQATRSAGIPSAWPPLCRLLGVSLPISNASSIRVSPSTPP